MAGLSLDPGDFFRYLAVAYSTDMVMAALFRVCVFLTPSVIVGEVRQPRQRGRAQRFKLLSLMGASVAFKSKLRFCGNF